MWIACLHVPLFPLAARLRSEPELLGEALVVCQGNGERARVVAATRAARRCGVEAGQTLPQARALCPKLIARGRDPACERAAQEALAEAAESVSPRVEDAAAGLLYADADGLERRFGGGPPGGRERRRGESGDPGDRDGRRAGGAPPGRVGRDGLGDRGAPGSRDPAGSAGQGDRGAPSDRDARWPAEVGRALIAAAGRAGLPARAGLAASKLAARIAAGLPDSPTVVPAGGEAAFLAPLPLARLPEAEVASRLGAAGQALHTTARGLDPHPLVPRRPPPAFREGMTLEWPLVAIEPFLFVGRAALERLVGRLEARGLGCARLEVALTLEPDGRDERGFDLPAPTRDAKTLLTLVRLDLEARPPGAPVAGFAFLAHPDRPREAQLSLFGPAALSPDRLAATLARLFALLGADRVGSPRTVDGHRPERFALVRYAPPPPPETRRAPASSSGGRGLMAVRALRPPLALEVLTAGGVAAASVGGGGAGVDGETNGDGGTDGETPGDGGGADDETPAAGGGADGTAVAIATGAPPADLRPLEVRSLPAETKGTAGAETGRFHPPGPAARPLRLAGRVRVAAGPWTLEEGWWTETPVERDYWDVELDGGGVYRLYRDRSTGDWFADGMYD